MRLWTLHPRYLDARGLVALWREALLAQAVLRGRTRGYRAHPQLMRFRGHPRPIAAIAMYLRVVHAEAASRNYTFDGRKIARASACAPIAETDGQMRYEWAHLKRKLRQRDPDRLAGLSAIRRPDPHPLFVVHRGGIRAWERPVSEPQPVRRKNPRPPRRARSF